MKSARVGASAFVRRRIVKPRLLVSLVVVVAAACGAHKGTTTTLGTGAALTTGSAGGSVFATGASASSCGFIGAGKGEGGAAAACTGVPSGISYSKDIAPIFAGCMGDVCHAPWSRENSVNVPANQCCDGRSFITPGDPSKSYIVNKLEGKVCVGRQMPLDPDVVTPDQVKLIVGWICEGAPDN